MKCISHYSSPVGRMLLAADDAGLTGVWFEGQKFFALHLIEGEYQERDMPLFKDVRRWFNIYFSGKEPEFKIPLHLKGTDFQLEVWKILCMIPYGKTTTYGQIADVLADRRKIPRMSAQAVGGAVARNPVSIIVPCHRVVGKNGSLTGYAGGIDRKMKLLALEGAEIYFEKEIQQI